MSLRSRFTALFHSRRLDADLDDELRSHLEMRVEHNLAAGMSPEEARRDAVLRFGNRALMKEDARGSDILPWLDSLAQDVRYGLRILGKNPGFTLVAVITLALGIGANTAVFSVLRAVLLRSLPFPQSQQLVRVDEVDASGEWGRSGMVLKGISPPDLAAFREQNHSFEQIGGWTGGAKALSGQGEPRRVDTTGITYNLFRVLGIHPMLGRDFLPGEEAAGANHVAIVSYSLWQSLGGGSDFAARSLMLNAESYTVVGVMPPGFQFPLGQDAAAIWTPLTLSRDPALRAANYIEAVGRLKPGLTPLQAKTDLDLISLRAGPSPTMGRRRWATAVTNLKDDLTAGARAPLGILAAAVAFVLLIAAANVASLCLTRSAARQREIAVRLALGCSRARLLRQLLVESILLALLGGASGLVLAHWSAQAMLSSAPASLPRIAPAQLDVAVLAFTLGLSLLTGIAAGIAPAWRAARFDVHRVMKEGAAGFRPGRQPLHAFFAVVQLALAAILLCGAGLMVRTLARLALVDPGFNPQSVLTAQVSLPQQLYRTPEQQTAFADQLLERLRALPQVQSAAAGNALPMDGTRMVFHLVITNPGQPDISVISAFASVTPDYFRALGIPLTRGRLFTDSDNRNGQMVAVVNQSLARKRWGNEDPIGKKIANGFTPQAPVVVGVVGDVHQDALDRDPGPQLYVPFAQRPWPFLRLALRSRSGDAAALAPDLRAQVRSLDAMQSVDQVLPAERLLARSVAQRRFFMTLLSVFAALALGLAAVGVFGVMAYSVSQRTREIGVRMALGATRGNVLGMIVGRALLLTTIGLAVGVGASLALTQLLRTLLFQTRPRDPLTFVAAAALLAATSLAASLLPARRASRVDPMVALRYE